MPDTLNALGYGFPTFMITLNVVIVSQALVLYQCRVIISMIYDVSEGVYIQWNHCTHISFFFKFHRIPWQTMASRLCFPTML